jgi:hypothetical protein
MGRVPHSDVMAAMLVVKEVQDVVEISVRPAAFQKSIVGSTDFPQPFHFTNQPRYEEMMCVVLFRQKCEKHPLPTN